MDGMHCTNVCGKGSHEITPPYDKNLILNPMSLTLHSHSVVTNSSLWS
jgi:hypothetical protein